MLKTALLTLGLTLTSMAHAQSQDQSKIFAADLTCLPSKVMFALIQKEYGEDIVLVSSTSFINHNNGERYQGIMMLTARPDWSTHTITITFDDGMTCALVDGGGIVPPSEMIKNNR